MAVEYVKPKCSAGAGSHEAGSQTFFTEYTVKSDTPTESRAIILACGLLPIYGSPHPENPAAICVDVDARRNRDDPYFWDVRAEWNTVTRGKWAPQEDQKAPDQRRPRWRFNFIEIPQSWFHDLDGKLFADTAGIQFAPPPDLPIFVDEVTITRYESTLNRTADRGYLNATNTDPWNGAAAGTALVRNIATEEVYEWGAYWFLRTFTVLVNPKILVPVELALDTEGQQICKGGWDPHYVLNAGPKSLVTINGKKVPVPHVDLGVTDGQPQPLKPDGSLVPRNPTTGALVFPVYFCKFRRVNKASFAPLNLVPPWVV